MHSATHVDAVLGQCEVRRVCEKAPHAPTAGTSKVSMFNEKLQADFLFPDNLTALRAVAVFSKYSPLTPARSKNRQEVSDAFCNSRIGVFGQPQLIQTQESGAWKNEVRTDLRPARRTKLRFQGVGAHPMDS